MEREYGESKKLHGVKLREMLGKAGKKRKTGVVYTADEYNNPGAVESGETRGQSTAGAQSCHPRAANGAVSHYEICQARFISHEIMRAGGRKPLSRRYERSRTSERCNAGEIYLSLAEYAIDDELFIADSPLFRWHPSLSCPYGDRPLARNMKHREIERKRESRVQTKLTRAPHVQQSLRNNAS